MNDVTCFESDCRTAESTGPGSQDRNFRAWLPKQHIAAADSTDSSWRECPKVNSRNNFPVVEGDAVPTRAHPRHPVASFGAGFADPDLILGAPIWTFSPSSRRSPVGSATVITGTGPGADLSVAVGRVYSGRMSSVA